MWKSFAVAAFGLTFAASSMCAQTSAVTKPDTAPTAASASAGVVTPAPAKPQETPVDVAIAPGAFNQLADAGLLAMRQTAETMKVGGVAVVSYFDGDRIEAWSSKMLVVGRMKDEPSATQKGNNLLAIVYAKAAEMADTLKNSGSQVRPPMTGEFGWEGGLIVRVKGGYLIAAFSGGQSADDVAISHAGLNSVLRLAAAAH